MRYRYIIILLILNFYCLGFAGVTDDVNEFAPPEEESTSVQSIFRFVPNYRGFGDPMPFYWKGEYHVFYLTNPTGNYDVNWEHIVSTDLIHWKELPTALSVDHSDPKGPDGGCIFTGDIEEKDGIFHAWYTNWNPLNPEGREFISHATSRDLINWTKHPEHIIAPDGIHYANHPERDFRDPEIIWNPEEEKYWMFLFANVPNEWSGRMALLTSDDLINWEQEAPIEGVPGDECASYLKFGDIHYIISNSYGYCYADNIGGPYKRPKFWNSIPVDRLDSGGQAAKTVWDGKRYLWFGGWSGRSMPIPREVYPGPEGLLYLMPAEEILSFFNKTSLDLSEKSLDTSIEVPPVYMLDYQINMNPKSQITLSFGDKYVVSVNPSQAKLSVNGPGIDVGRPCPVDTSKPVKIQVFVDETMIEIFINDQYAQTCPIDKWWPMEPTLKISKQYGEVDVRKLQVRVPE